MTAAEIAIPRGRRAASVAEGAARPHRGEAPQRGEAAPRRARRRGGIVGHAGAVAIVIAHRVGDVGRPCRSTAALGDRAPSPRSSSSSSTCSTSACFGWPPRRTAWSHVLAAGATAGRNAPLGIAWDIACYLPQTGTRSGRRATPSGPCPRSPGGSTRWLRRPEGGRVVSGSPQHGRGARRVDVSDCWRAPTRTRTLLPRISLLTFGVQLRPFFGRMLPELLGPAVLGGRPSASDRRLLGVRPMEGRTSRAVGRTSIPARSASPSSSRSPPVGRLDWHPRRRRHGRRRTPVRWVSLWRLTDYLGYPAMSTAIGGGRRGMAQRRRPVRRRAGQERLHGGGGHARRVLTE